MKWIIALLFLLFNLGLFGDSNRYKTYEMMIRDLKNVTTFGYREISQSVSRAINSNGPFHMVWGKNLFAISGKGFFRVYDKKRKRYLYTRHGFFEKVKDVFVTVEGYVLTDEIKIKKNHGMTFKDMLLKSLNDSGSKMDKASILKMPLYINGELVKRDEKKHITHEVFRCNLYLPKEIHMVKLTDNVKYFSFKEIKILKNVQIYNNCLETSNVWPIAIMSKMIIILESKLKNKESNNERIIKKIKVLRFLLKKYKNALSTDNRLYIIEDFVPQLKIYLPYLEKLD